MNIVGWYSPLLGHLQPQWAGLDPTHIFECHPWLKTGVVKQPQNGLQDLFFSVNWNKNHMGRCHSPPVNNYTPKVWKKGYNRNNSLIWRVGFAPDLGQRWHYPRAGFSTQPSGNVTPGSGATLPLKSGLVPLNKRTGEKCINPIVWC